MKFVKVYFVLAIAVCLFSPLAAVNASPGMFEPLDQQAVQVKMERPLDGLKPWNFLYYGVNYMIDNGVPSNTLYMLLILPVIATMIAFSRQVIGVKSFGIYAPTVVAVSLLATGLKYGLGIFLIVLIVGTLMRFLASKSKLMFLPRMAIVLSLVSFSILGLFLLGAVVRDSQMVSLSVFPILIMVIITERFVSVQIEQGTKTAMKLIAETLVLAIACYLLVTWSSFRWLIMNYPEVVLGTLVLNVIVGRWVGLRLLELYRFRKVVKHVRLPEKE